MPEIYDRVMQQMDKKKQTNKQKTSGALKNLPKQVYFQRGAGPTAFSELHTV